MKRSIFALLMFLFVLPLIINAVYFENKSNVGEGIAKRSRYEKFPLNTYVLERYNIVSYGHPFGSLDDPENLNIGWLKTESGLMTKGNNSIERGEYKYLGFTFEEEPITNDRYFLNEDKTGKVFDRSYSGMTWTPVVGSLAIWDYLSLYKSTIHDYILNAKFWDRDHVSAGKEPTGYTIKSFCSEKGIDYRTHALIQAEPTKDNTGTVKFEYIRNSDGMANYNTVEIPPLPHVKGYLKAYPNIKYIEKGKKQDIVVTLDTSGSYALLNNLKDENLTNRTYWASTGAVAGSGSDSTGSVYQITVPQVSPNTTINVQIRVYSREVDDLNMEDIPPYDIVTDQIFIGQIEAPPPLDYTRPHAQGVIKADTRDHEAFDVSKGIPSGETVYAQVVSENYLYRMNIRPVSGSVSYSVTVNHLDKEGEPTTSHVTIPRYYTYWEITSFELFAITAADIENQALPGHKVTLNPSASYQVPSFEVTHDPNDKYSYHVSEGSTSATVSSSAVSVSEVYAAAQSAASSPSVRNDRLIINGKVIMDTYGGLQTSQLVPEKTSRDILYTPGLRIPEQTANGSHESKGTITYERIYTYEPVLEDTLSFDLDEVNPVFVHTPVCVEATLSSDDAHNQKPHPAEGASALILGRPFTVDISNAGTHRNIQGYGSRDYTRYLEDREIRFDFDTYFGTSMGGTYLKANTWHSLKGLGVDHSQGKLSFYTPTWVDEGLYNVEIRNIAINDASNGSNTESGANLTPTRTAAADSKTVEVSGRVYDFAVTDIDDVSWELFFRQAKGKPEPTGKVFFPGPRNMNGDPEAQRKYILPVMPGKNDTKGFQNRSVKLGYAFKFELKTMGNYYDAYDFVRIMPTFAFVDKEGKNRQEVDLYYRTPERPLIRIGSPEDTLTQTARLDFRYRGINPMEFIKTAEAMFRLRGGIQGYTLDKWIESFPKVSQNGVVFAKYFKLLLSEPLRSFIGPDRGIPQGVDPDKALASVQKWYGEYRLPADCLVVPKGTDLSRLGNLSTNSAVFLKDGYIVVNFKDIAVINDDHFNSPSLQYTGRTADGWALEGYSTSQGGWQLLPGDVVAYHEDQRATDDVTGTGTH